MTSFNLLIFIHFYHIYIYINIFINIYIYVYIQQRVNPVCLGALRGGVGGGKLRGERRQSGVRCPGVLR